MNPGTAGFGKPDVVQGAGDPFLPFAEGEPRAMVQAQAEIHVGSHIEPRQKNGFLENETRGEVRTKHGPSQYPDFALVQR